MVQKPQTSQLKYRYFLAGLLAWVTGIGMVYAQTSDWQRRVNTHRHGMVVQEKIASDSGPVSKPAPNREADGQPDGRRGNRGYGMGPHGSGRHAYRNEGGYCGDQKACPNSSQGQHRARRLTQDERRVLRNQLNEASQTIYRNDAH